MSSTMASQWWRIRRQPCTGGRGKLLNEQQEQEICNMVMANNAITLRQIHAAILQDNAIFQNVNSISISTIDRILKKHQMTMKQIYRVPFERNSDRVKELWYQYVHRIMALEGNETPHILVFVDEAGFNLAKGRRHGRNIIGHRATVDVPGQRGGNITMCAAISENGVATHIPSLGPYNTQKLLIFLDRLHFDLIPENERRPHLPQYVIVWDNVNFHRGPLIRAWFTTHPRMVMYFSAWRWRVYEHRAQDQRSLLHAMDAACEDITGDQCRGWLRHARHFFPRCIAKENIRCDVDENLWPDRLQRVDGQEGEDGGQEREVRTATSEELLVVKRQLYLQHCRLHIILIVFYLCVYITVYYAVYIFFLL
ncbi:hypothetical protein IRJ41_015737 [Triplophysa rosa]|uniref:Tc1-like transposase DDE domain-containing protein n=1 Tax=Triplophysa rosa TaxID=992332 RepID=A0A9W7TQZ0_TRIRA|nr:hypothetical protein IRJ41_015737 [Triplophysa rosa]